MLYVGVLSESFRPSRVEFYGFQDLFLLNLGPTYLTFQAMYGHSLQFAVQPYTGRIDTLTITVPDLNHKDSPPSKSTCARIFTIRGGQQVRIGRAISTLCGNGAFVMMRRRPKQYPANYSAYTLQYGPNTDQYVPLQRQRHAQNPYVDSIAEPNGP